MAVNEMVQLPVKTAEAILEQLKYLIVVNGAQDIAREHLTTIYEMFWDDLIESGGCDHSVGICACQEISVVYEIAAVLGWPLANEYADAPTPQALRRFNLRPDPSMKRSTCCGTSGDYHYKGCQKELSDYEQKRQRRIFG